MQCPACTLECPPDATICPRCNSDLVEPPSRVDYVRTPQEPPQQWTVISSADRATRMPRWVLVVAGVAVLAVLGTGIGYAVGRGGPTNGGQTSGGPTNGAGPQAGSSGAVPAAQPTQPAPQSTDEASPTSGADAIRQQATALDALITTSKATRGKLGDALNNVDQCQNLTGAAAQLVQVAAERNAEINQLKALAVDALPGGASMRDVLVEALTYSMEADQGYADWARALSGGGCVAPAGHDRNWQTADVASQKATEAKLQFLSAWNPVAGSNGLPTRVDTDL